MSGRTFVYRHRVSYSECTIGNHVYYARYLDILEAARGELFRALGKPLLQLQEEGIIFPVIECRLSFKSPARYDDMLDVILSISRLDRVRVGFSYKVNHASSRTILEAETTHVCTSISERPKRIPDDLAALFRPFATRSDEGQAEQVRL